MFSDAERFPSTRSPDARLATPPCSDKLLAGSFLLGAPVSERDLRLDVAPAVRALLGRGLGLEGSIGHHGIGLEIVST